MVSAPRCPSTRLTSLLVAVLTVTGTLLATSHASATIVLHLDVETLSAESANILVGRVEATSSRWIDRKIVTDVTVRTAISIKGDAREGDVLTVRRMGGRVDDLAQRIAGEPDFQVGEDVLVFLEAGQPDRPPMIMGMAQGKFQVAVGPDSRLWAVRDTSDLALAVLDTTADGRKQMRFVDQDALVASGALLLSDLVRGVALCLRDQGQEPNPALLRRIGADLLAPYDFRRDLANGWESTAPNWEVNP